MNYRHVFHAGNFADLLKHAVLLEIVSRMTATGCGPLTVIDTHGGAGVYDLAGDAARRTGEGAAIAALVADETAPAVFTPLKAAVSRLNDQGVRHYPGSPLLIAEALRPRDRLIACETRREDFEVLREVLRGPAIALREDGWDVARLRTPKAPAAAFLLIDPPYEAPDDAQRAARAVRGTRGRNDAAVIAVWAPIKDLASFDALVSNLEEAASGRPVLVVETRLRPPDDPLKLNGCAMIVINPTPGLHSVTRVAAEWISRAFGSGVGEGRVSDLSGNDRRRPSMA